MSIKLEVWGDYACFTRPELKTERYSYDVMTPGAAVGMAVGAFVGGIKGILSHIF